MSSKHNNDDVQLGSALNASRSVDEAVMDKLDELIKSKTSGDDLHDKPLFRICKNWRRSKTLSDRVLSVTQAVRVLSSANASHRDVRKAAIYLTSLREEQAQFSFAVGYGLALGLNEPAHCDFFEAYLESAAKEIYR
jgi:hypothetical protein